MMREMIHADLNRACSPGHGAVLDALLPWRAPDVYDRVCLVSQEPLCASGLPWPAELRVRAYSNMMMLWVIIALCFFWLSADGLFQRTMAAVVLGGAVALNGAQYSRRSDW